MNILIVYSTIEGQTRKIAEFIKAEAEKLKHTATLCDVTTPSENPEEYDAVLIGASVHSEKYQSSIRDYIHRHKQILNRMHSGFFSVSLTAATDDKQLWEELKITTSSLLETTGWRPRMVEYVAGALLYTQYDFFKKFSVRLIANKTSQGNEKTQDTQYTDWDKLQLFSKAFIDKWVPLPITIEEDTSDQAAIG